MFEITLKRIFLLSKYIRTILEIRYLEYDEWSSKISRINFSFFL